MNDNPHRRFLLHEMCTRTGINPEYITRVLNKEIMKNLHLLVGNERVCNGIANSIKHRYEEAVSLGYIKSLEALTELRQMVRTQKDNEEVHILRQAEKERLQGHLSNQKEEDEKTG